VTTTTLRTAPPFLPDIARGLDTSRPAVGAALSAGELGGLASPLVGRAVDRRPRRWAMVTGASLLALACALAAASPGVVLLGAALTVLVLGKVTFDTGMNAWVADRVPFAQRGRVTGMVEVSWAGALLLGVPLMGLAVAWWGWRAPFVALAAANGTAALAMARRLPRDAAPAATHLRSRLVLTRPMVALFGVVGVLSLASQIVFVSYASWLRDAFGLGAAAVGGLTIGLGVGELAGTGTTTLVADRWGKRRTVVAGAAVMLPCCLLFGPAEGHTWAAVLVLGVMVAGYETAFVATIPLVAELTPKTRAASIGVALGTMTLARACAALVGTRLYDRAGMDAVGVLAAGLAAVAVVVAVVGVEEPDRAGSVVEQDHG